MVQCTGPIYNSSDYAALNAKLSRDELVKMKAALERLNATSNATQDALNKQLQTFNSDLRANIEKRFQDLPNDVLLSAAIQNLRKSLIEYVDQRLPRTPPNIHPLRGLRRRPKASRARPRANPDNKGLGRGKRRLSKPGVSDAPQGGLGESPCSFVFAAVRRRSRSAARGKSSRGDCKSGRSRSLVISPGILC